MPITTGERLYVVVRDDLSPGLQAAQAVHAAVGIQARVPERIAKWMDDSNVVAILSVRNGNALANLMIEAEAADVRMHAFFDPDLMPSLTAIAFEPGPKSERLCGKLSLALQQRS